MTLPAEQALGLARCRDVLSDWSRSAVHGERHGIHNYDTFTRDAPIRFFGADHRSLKSVSADPIIPITDRRSRPSGRKPPLAPPLVTAPSRGRDGRARPSVPVRAGAAAGGLDRLLCCPRQASEFTGASGGPRLVIGGDRGGLRPGPSSAAAEYPTNQMP